MGILFGSNKNLQTTVFNFINNFINKSYLMQYHKACKFIMVVGIDPKIYGFKYGDKTSGVII